MPGTCPTLWLAIYKETWTSHVTCNLNIIYWIVDTFNFVGVNKMLLIIAISEFIINKRIYLCGIWKKKEYIHVYCFTQQWMSLLNIATIIITTRKELSYFMPSTWWENSPPYLTNIFPQELKKLPLFLINCVVPGLTDPFHFMCGRCWRSDK